jgi:hypothetical protein
MNPDLRKKAEITQPKFSENSIKPLANICGKAIALDSKNISRIASLKEKSPGED